MAVKDLTSNTDINSARGAFTYKRVAITVNPSQELPADKYGVAGDVIKLASLPQGSVIHTAYLDVLTADAAAADVNLGASTGDATSAILVDSADCTSTGIKKGGTLVVFTQPIIVSSAGMTLKLTAATNAITDGVVRVVVGYMEPQAQVIEGGQIAPGSEK